jgi:hypothetical protein
VTKSDMVSPSPALTLSANPLIVSLSVARPQSCPGARSTAVLVGLIEGKFSSERSRSSRVPIAMKTAMKAVMTMRMTHKARQMRSIRDLMAPSP